MQRFWYPPSSSDPQVGRVQFNSCNFPYPVQHAFTDVRVIYVFVFHSIIVSFILRHKCFTLHCKRKSSTHFPLNGRKYLSFHKQGGRKRCKSRWWRLNCAKTNRILREELNWEINSTSEDWIKTTNSQQLWHKFGHKETFSKDAWRFYILLCTHMADGV